jgi:hypothetical protein
VLLTYLMTGRNDFLLYAAADSFYWRDDEEWPSCRCYYNPATQFEILRKRNDKPISHELLAQSAMHMILRTSRMASFSHRNVDMKTTMRIKRMKVSAKLYFDFFTDASCFAHAYPHTLLFLVNTAIHQCCIDFISEQYEIETSTFRTQWTIGNFKQNDVIPLVGTIHLRPVPNRHIIFILYVFKQLTLIILALLVRCSLSQKSFCLVILFSSLFPLERILTM